MPESKLAEKLGTCPMPEMEQLGKLNRAEKEKKA